MRLDAAHRRLRNGSEAEFGDDAELTSPGAAQPPDQVGLPCVIAVDDAAVGEQDLRADELIAGQPVSPAEEADAPAEGEPGDADGGAASGRKRSSGAMKGGVRRCQECTCADRRDAVRVDDDPIEVCEVEQDPVGGGTAGEAVAAPADGERDLVVHHEGERPSDIGDRSTPDDGGRPDVVKRRARRAADQLVALRVAGQYRSIEGACEDGQVKHVPTLDVGSAGFLNGSRTVTAVA